MGWSSRQPVRERTPSRPSKPSAASMRLPEPEQLLSRTRAEEDSPTAKLDNTVHKIVLMERGVSAFKHEASVDTTDDVLQRLNAALGA